jgi:hypothetical protein
MIYLSLIRDLVRPLPRLDIARQATRPRSESACTSRLGPTLHCLRPRGIRQSLPAQLVALFSWTTQLLSRDVSHWAVGAPALGRNRILRRSSPRRSTSLVVCRKRPPGGTIARLAPTLRALGARSAPPQILPYVLDIGSKRIFADRGCPVKRPKSRQSSS